MIYDHEMIRQMPPIKARFVPFNGFSLVKNHANY